MTINNTASDLRKESDVALRVMIVDDSLIIRGLISRILKEEPGIDVMASVSNGQLAVERVRQGGIDVVVLDIEMPVMDGLTALPLLLEQQPDLVVIMASTLTTRNADVSLKALKAGATDYVPKPTTNKDLFSAEDFRRELIRKVKALGLRAVQARKQTARTATPSLTGGKAAPAPIALRQASAVTPRIVAIASSTGGPQALQTTLKAIGPKLPVPIVITQHMPPTFTQLLAKNLTRDTGVQCDEAVDGQILIPGQALIAPGDFHMTLVPDNQGARISLNQDLPENFCRPAADPMLRSAVKVFRSSVLAVVLTGMGSDGEKGCQDVVGVGGTVIAQDEKSSVVWGMPGAVAKAGLCHAVLPIDQVGHKIRNLLRV